MPVKTSKFIWHDGKLVPWEQATVHVLSHALHYGSSVFEGLRVYKTPDGPIGFRLTDHIRRWDTIFDLLEVDDDCRERLWWTNGAEIYGLEAPSWAKPSRKRSTAVRIATNGARPAKPAAKKGRAASRRSR